MTQRTSIPARFWQSLTKPEFNTIIDTSRLNAAQCATVWRMLDRQDQPPDSMVVEIRADDVMRIWKATTPESSRP